LLLDGARLWSFHEQIERGQMAAIRGAKASRWLLPAAGLWKG